MRKEFLEKYDEEDVERLMETWGNPMKNCHRITFINDGVGGIEKNRDIARRIASDADWDFEEFQGGPDLFRRLISGDWDEDSFLVIPPGSAIKPGFTEAIICAAEAKP